MFNNDEMKAYLLFQEYSLYFCNEFNVLFQCRRILIDKLSESELKLIKQMGQNFLLPIALQHISSDD